LNITILICTFNGKHKLRDTLSHISNLNLTNNIEFLEIVLVDNASSDGTTEFAQALWDTLNSKINLKIIFENKPGKAHALTTGYNVAKGDLIVLCDDDNWLDKQFLIHAEERFRQEPELGMAGGYGIAAIFANDNKPYWFDDFQGYYVVGTHHPHSRVLTKNDYSIYGAGSVIRKSVWDEIYRSGFRFQNSSTAGRAIAEDVELSMAVAFAGYKLYFDQRLTFTHDLRWGRISIDNLIDQEKANAKGLVFLRVYELLYHRLGCRFLFLRFLKDYMNEILNFHLAISRLKKNKKDYDPIRYRVLLSSKKSTCYHLWVLMPQVLFRFRFYHSWISNLVLGK